MSHYETRAGPSPCILECFKKEYRLQIAHCDFVHRLDVPSQMQRTTSKSCTLDLKKNRKLGPTLVRNFQTIPCKCWVCSHRAAYGPTVLLEFWYLHVFTSLRIRIAEVKTFFSLESLLKIEQLSYPPVLFSNNMSEPIQSR